jgi:hypothetical protein
MFNFPSRCQLELDAGHCRRKVPTVRILGTKRPQADSFSQRLGRERWMTCMSSAPPATPRLGFPSYIEPTMGNERGKNLAAGAYSSNR